MKKNIYNKLLTFAESRSLFFAEAPGQDQPAAAPAANETVTPSPEAVEAPKEVSKQNKELQAEITIGLKFINEVVDQVVNNGDQYTEGLVNTAKSIKQDSLYHLESEFKAISMDIGQLAEFQTQLSSILTEVNANLGEGALLENKNHKQYIQTEKDALEKKKTELLDDNKLIEKISKPSLDTKSKAALLQGIKSSGAYKQQLVLQDSAIKSLEIAEKAPDSTSTVTMLNEYNEKIKEFATFDEYIKDRAQMVEKISLVRDASEQMLAMGGEALEDLFEKANELLANPESTPGQMDALFDNYQNKIIFAYLADEVTKVVEASPEDVENAISYYSLGEFGNPSEKQSKYTQIINEISRLKKAGKIPGIKFNFDGFTDATKTNLRSDQNEKDKVWHNERKAAFEKLLEFADNDNLRPRSLLEHIKSNRSKIEGYIKATDRAAYIRSNNLTDLFTISKGTENGGLFDAALALKRAENMKKRIEGDEAKFDAKSEKLKLVLDTQESNSKEKRKSQFHLSIEAVSLANPETPKAPEMSRMPETPQSKVPVEELEAQKAIEEKDLKEGMTTLPENMTPAEPVDYLEGNMSLPQDMSLASDEDLNGPLKGDMTPGPETAEEKDKQYNRELAKLKEEGGYDLLDTFYEGFARVRKNEHWGLIDLAGRVIADCKYDAMSSFSDGKAVAKLDNKFGLINGEGKIIAPFNYDFVDSFSEGMARVKIGDKYGLISKTGELVAECKYDFMDTFAQGMTRVKIGDKLGLIDGNGKLLADCIYDSIGTVSDRKVVATIGSQKYEIRLDRVSDPAVIPLEQDTNQEIPENLRRPEAQDRVLENNPRFERLLEIKGIVPSSLDGLYKDTLVHKDSKGFFRGDEGFFYWSKGALIYKNREGEHKLVDPNNFDDLKSAWEKVPPKTPQDLPANLQNKGFYLGREGDLYRKGVPGRFELKADKTLVYKYKDYSKSLAPGADLD